MALQANPALFPDTLDQSLNLIDEQVRLGVLPEENAMKLRQVTGSELAQNAVRGWATINPETAKDIIEKGTYDKYISGDQKKQLLQEVSTMKNAQEIETERTKRAIEDANKKKAELWENENLGGLENNAISTKQILNSPLDPQRKVQWLNMMKKNLNQKIETDPTVKNELIRKVLLPSGDPQKITDATQLYDKVGRGITIDDVKKISSFMESTPEGVQLRDNRKRVMDLAKTILVRKDPIMGLQDPDGEYNMAAFSNFIAEKESEYRDQKRPISELYNPNSKDYIGNEVFKYKNSPEEILNKQMKRRESFKAPEGQGRRQGETPAEFLKRTKGS